MFRTATDGLYRGPHIVVARYKIPTRGQEIRGLDSAAQISGLGSGPAAVRQCGWPDNLTIAHHNSVRSPEATCFLRIECGVDSAKDYKGTALTADLANGISTQGILGMDADPDDITRLNAIGVQRMNCFIDETRVAEGRRRSRCNH